MENKITSKSTKNQILEAYESLLSKLKSQKSEEPKKVQEEQKKEEIVSKAGELSNEGIIKRISDLKVSVSSSLDNLGEQYLTEYKKFAELQEAIEIEKNNLKDLYGLSANSDSLAAMILAQKEQKESFEKEMANQKSELEDLIKSEKENFEHEMSQKREVWKKEQIDQDLKAKETQEELKKSRKRDEEEYEYNLKIKRKKEQDIYEQNKLQQEKELEEKKVSFEKDYEERMSKLKESENELIELRQKTKEFPEELSKAIEMAVKDAVDKIKAEHSFQIELKAKEVEGELRLKDQTINALEAKISEMEISMKEMSVKTATAENSVKDIAIKAIESSSKPSYMFEKKPENSKE